MGTWVACSNPPDSSGLSHYLFACQRLTADGRDRSGKDGLRVQSAQKAEAQKPKTFRVATFYAQKLSGQSARNRFSRQA